MFICVIIIMVNDLHENMRFKKGKMSKSRREKNRIDVTNASASPPPTLFSNSILTTSSATSALEVAPDTSPEAGHDANILEEAPHANNVRGTNNAVAAAVLARNTPNGRSHYRDSGAPTSLGHASHRRPSNNPDYRGHQCAKRRLEH